MAWIQFWIVFVALSTTSAYIHQHHGYHTHQGQDNKEYQNAYDDSYELDTSFRIPDLKKGTRDVQINFENLADSDTKFEGQMRYGNLPSGVWGPKIPVGRFDRLRYYQTRVQEEGRSPSSKSVRVRNRNYAATNVNILAKTQLREESMKDADYVKEMIRSETRNMFIPIVPTECEKKGYCENSSDYPHEYVEALLAKLPKGKILFNMDPEPEMTGKEYLQINETVELCKSDVKLVYPDKIRTNVGKWVFAINGRHNKVQAFLETACKSQGKPCDHLVEFDPSYNPICEQKYSNRLIWAIGHYGEMVQVTTRTASCCTCELIKTKSRFGLLTWG